MSDPHPRDSTLLDPVANALGGARQEADTCLDVAMLFPIHCTGDWVSYTALSLATAMRGPGMDVRLWVPSAERTARRDHLREAVPRPLWKLLYRSGRPDWVTRLAERRFLAALRPGQPAYLFPGTSLELLHRIRRRGHTLIIERINCQESTAKPLLDEAYRHLGVPVNPSITDAMIRESREVVALADWIFSPSPHVTRSLVADGVPGGRILQSSYGWEPARFTGADSDRALPAAEGITVLFVGSVSVRKGANLLLEAWARAGVRGRLALAGRVEPLIAERCAAHLNRSDVVLLGHRSDMGVVYRSADVFAFPTHEEGSPLVTYEAMGCGLPLVISPMGAGAVARDGQEAIVLDPYNIDAWVDALRRLAADADYRRALGEQARRRAREFVWTEVGARRRTQLLGAVSAGVANGCRPEGYPCSSG